MSKDPEDTNIAKAVANDADAMKYTKGFGVQWNLQAAVATAGREGAGHADGAQARKLRLRDALLGPKPLRCRKASKRSPVR